MPTPSPLEYAPRPPMHRRRSFRRISAAILVMVLVASGWWWGPSAWQRVELLFWQHKCEVRTPIPGQLAFDSATGLRVVPNEWNEFYKCYSRPGTRSDGTIFVGEMKNQGGENRFVAIDLLVVQSFPGSVLVTIPRVFERRGLYLSAISSGPFTPNTLLWDGAVITTAGQNLKVDTAKLDAEDLSHLTFSIDRNGMLREYNAWLQNDDTVVIGERRPAASAP